MRDCIYNNKVLLYMIKWKNVLMKYENRIYFTTNGRSSIHYVIVETSDTNCPTVNAYACSQIASSFFYVWKIAYVLCKDSDRPRCSIWSWLWIRKYDIYIVIDISLYFLQNIRWLFLTSIPLPLLIFVIDLSTRAYDLKNVNKCKIMVLSINW